MQGRECSQRSSKKKQEEVKENLTFLSFKSLIKSILNEGGD